MKKRILFLLIIILIGNIFLTSNVHAQLDQRCWTKQECIDARKESAKPFEMTEAEAADGFYNEPDAVAICGEKSAAGEEMGFCLPSYKTKTQIKFGGNDTFLHMGEFIQFMYRYGIWIVGLAAVFMIIVAGFQRLTSGGNPDSIQSSNKKITGSIIGVTLAVTSYLILNTINPALVNLRLPQIWMVNPQALTPSFCSELDDTQLVAPLGPSGQQYSNEQKETAYKSSIASSAFQPISQAKPKCGTDFLVDGAGSATCSGTFCKEGGGQVCFQGVNNNDKVPTCKKGNIAGLVYNSNIFADTFIGALNEDFEWPWVTDPITPGQDALDLEATCMDGTLIENIVSLEDLSTYDDIKKIQFYSLSISENEISETIDTCSSHGGLKGFMLDMSFNEDFALDSEDHYIVNNSSRVGIDLGDLAAFKKTRLTTPKEMFISPDDLRQGIQLDINAGKVCDIDNAFEDGHPRRKQCYGKYGYE